ncbi:DNA cytosine methyltransferase [Poseidonibacter ostreae]|jgi:DNA (cytosine-5)-methyltransferase 1|uniref:DNA (cytosine-5-)-methyltransferase n=1 Tax=Poseidonibacter ostreae TaxID=2654171 RepID=A0A6L4WRD2_9BACT|nr:DNA cytosine methyltransferase [Poseidonibacter ostreae]KAB7887776.1 restriction endonuclease [Poseidonibacter ostreae]KAB7888235.1 restriction endonuclease [Poseidonibacter ostreae]KAB7890961.1 restriction endonuclease [Poseidonibacter ostreae]
MKTPSLFDFINKSQGKDIKALTYISLFSSAGIGCYGFKQQGFKCIATNEYLEKRIKIQQYNNKCEFDSGYIQGDLSTQEIQDRIYKELDNNNIKDLDILIATPPCQGMSVANHKKNNETKRNSLVVESIKIVSKIKPKFFVFENVRAFLNTICTDTDNIDKPIEESIELNLGGNYNILSKVVNFKEYGSQSSRTRTLVIGTRKDLVNISPYQLFPKQQKAKKLKSLIGDLPSLKIMGEISDNDIYHSYRNFDTKMLSWIENIKEGQSAFDNIEPTRIPHKIIDGEIVFNKNKNGDKYSRWYWDREAPCIHTRNDILASQSTIHPSDNRVFSIRELMRMMTISSEFKWSNIDFNTLNNLSHEEKKKYLKQDELNIRHCIGEAVPTIIFEQIAQNVKKVLKHKVLSINECEKIIQEYTLQDINNLQNFIINNNHKYDLNTLYNIAELSNIKRTETKAYFTREDIVHNVINKLPTFKNKKSIRILEPSVGIGNFLPLLFKKYDNIQNVILDIIDIDNNSLDTLKILLTKTKIPKNFTINFINTDFLLWENKYQYDLVVGNPPYGKVINNKFLLDKYKLDCDNKNTNNLFSFFIEKSIKISKYVSLIVPKSLINSPEFNQTREILEKKNLHSITDYGEKAFKGVKIETISFLLDTYKIEKFEKIKIESYITNTIFYQNKDYIFSKDFPYWLIYRNNFFDTIVNKMELDIFESFRDRQITKKHTLNSGNIRVLKSRNIANNSIKNIDNYDCFIDEIDSFVVSKYLNQNNIVLIPNLTYNPRATFLPKDTITDGSVALLKAKNNINITSNHLEYYSSSEFIEYYKIARNRGTRSLNIDNNSVQFFGLLKEA